MSDVEQRIANWRTDLTESQALSPSDMDEMENHLREEVTNLQTTGLSPTEAFLVAQYRLGETDALAISFKQSLQLCSLIRHSSIWRRCRADQPEHEGRAIEPPSALLFATTCCYLAMHRRDLSTAQ